MLNSLENPVETRYIRFRPKEWHNGIAMRVEVFGSSPHSGENDGYQLTVTKAKGERDEGKESSARFVCKHGVQLINS